MKVFTVHSVLYVPSLQDDHGSLKNITVNKIVFYRLHTLLLFFDCFFRLAQ